ncbi:hypothetical protein N0V88_001775 [Collariella sp. IMI 366227]|nr:hypothetical protein N0V88_001775 [Collariella sp. IMI 366227]
MAKGGGRLQHAVKAVKQKHKPGSKQQPPLGPPAAKKQKTTTTAPKPKPKNKNQHLQQNQQPTIPFSPPTPSSSSAKATSFAASLITHHRCTNITATVLEPDFNSLSAKYPHVAANTAVIESPPSPTAACSTASTPARCPPSPPPPPPNPNPPPNSNSTIPQVRANQELLVSFFTHAQRSLAPGGTIIVTLFEGEPYTLWNVRDLARHAGLQVERSFKFVAGVYPGYGHARTLGVGAKEGAEEGAGKGNGGKDNNDNEGDKGEDQTDHKLGSGDEASDED